MVELWILGVGVLAVYAIFGVLMALRKIDVLLALPIMAFLMYLVASLDPAATIDVVFVKGTFSQSSTIILIIVSAAVAELMVKTGMVQTLVRGAVELAGGRPTVAAFCAMAAVAYCHMGAWPFGTTVATGMVVLPILTALGIPGYMALSLFLFGICIGIAMSPVYYVIIVQSITKVPYSQAFPLPVALMVSIPYIAAFVVWWVWKAKKEGVSLRSAGVRQTTTSEPIVKAPIYSLITPAIPVLLILYAGWDPTAAFWAALLYGAVTTLPTVKSVSKQLDNVLRSFYDGLSSSGFQIILFLGIGMIGLAASGKAVTDSVRPILEPIMPTSIITFALFFAVLLPLIYFRGPLSPFGVGAGLYFLVASMLKQWVVPLSTIMWLYYIPLTWCDPTVSRDVWAAGFLKEPLIPYMKRILLIAWGVGAVVIMVAVPYLAASLK